MSDEQYIVAYDSRGDGWIFNSSSHCCGIDELKSQIIWTMNEYGSEDESPESNIGVFKLVPMKVNVTSREVISTIIDVSIKEEIK